MSPKLNMSRARARLINIIGIVGALYGLGTNILLEVDLVGRSFWGIMGIGSVIGLAAGSYFTRHYGAEEGYFAESLSVLNLGSGERKWRLPLPTVTVSHLNRRKSQIPDLKLQIALIHIEF